MAQPAQESDVWVLLRQRQGADRSEVMAVYVNEADMLARVERIKEANKHYPMRQHGDYSWTVGPDEDEGFFGNKPVDVWAVKSRFRHGEAP